MVFNFGSKKKKNSKIPKLNSKLQVHANTQRNVTVTNNLILTPQQSENLNDVSLYKKLSSNRAIFESNKLESACSFLRSLKEKLEKDADERKDTRLLEDHTSENITNILGTLMDMSDNITPMMSDVSNSTKSIFRNSVSESSSVSEKHFNKTMAAANKLLEITKNPGKSVNTSDGAYYFAQKIVANNLEELTIFKNNIKTVGDKIYVDKKLLTQLIDLHGLLKDTITKLKDQEQKFLADPKFREELQKAESFRETDSTQDAPKSIIKSHQQPMTAVPISEDLSSEIAPNLFDVSKQEDSGGYLTANDTEDASKFDTAPTEQSGSYLTADNMGNMTRLTVVPLIRQSRTSTPKSKRASNVSDSFNETDLDLYKTAPSSPQSKKKSSKKTPKSAPPMTPKALDFNESGDVYETAREQMDPSVTTGDGAETPRKSSKKDQSKAVVPVTSSMDEKSFRASKMKKKDLKASKGLLENATVLSAVTPDDPSEFSSGLKFAGKGVSIDDLTGSKFGKSPSEKTSEWETAEELITRQESQIPIGSQRSMSREGPFTPIEKRSSIRFDVPPGKAWADTGTGASYPELWTSTPKKDTKDAAACCGTKAPTRDATTSISPIAKLKRRKSQDTTDSMQASVAEKETATSGDLSVSRRNHRTQTSTKSPASPEKTVGDARDAKTGKITCRECLSKKLKKKSGKESKSGKGDVPIVSRSLSSISSLKKKDRTNVSERSSVVADSSKGGKPKSPKDRSKSKTPHKTPTALEKPGYIEGLHKCIAELECMSKCLRHATTSKANVHECIKIYPESQAKSLASSFPHFHTVIDGIPTVIQFTKGAIPIDNSLRDPHVKCCRKSCAGSTMDKADTCCKTKGADTKRFPCRLWDTISRAKLTKNSQDKSSKKWVPCKWGNSIFKSDTTLDGSTESTTADEGKFPKNDDNTTNDKRGSHKDKHIITTSQSQDSYCIATTEYTQLSVNVDAADSSSSMPYIADKSSLPKLEEPEKTCSSLSFDIRTVPVTFENSVLYHPDPNVHKGLKDVSMEQLLDSFRPAKCCRKTVLNEKPRGTMPYAASLQSLPLLQCDLQAIKRVIRHSNVHPAMYEKQTLFEHYVNFQKRLKDDVDKDAALYASGYRCRIYQVYFFELFKKDDDEKSNEQQSSSRSNSNNNLHDLRILDFLKKIYTIDPIYDKVSKKRQHNTAREDSDSKDGKTGHDRKTKKEHAKKKARDRRKLSEKKSSVLQNAGKYRITESKTCHTSVEFHSTSKTNCVPNSATSSVTSTKHTKSRNSSMYSFLLIPKSELSVCSSANDLSTSYAPSVTSLPIEDILEAPQAGSNCTQNTLTRASSEEIEDWSLSPKNYAKTLDGIYELDENGRIRNKGNVANDLSETNISEDSDIVPFIQSRLDLSGKLRNLSTIYETDERSTIKGSDANICQKISLKAKSSRSVSPKSSTSKQSLSKSKIPVSIHSYSSSAICKEKHQPSKTSNIISISSMCNSRSSASKSSGSSSGELGSKSSMRPSRKPSVPLCVPSTSKKGDGKRRRTVDAATSVKNLVAKVHPKVPNKSINAPVDKKCVSLQKALDGTSNFELPITFDIVKPNVKGDRNLKFEKNVMSYDIQPSDCSFVVQENKKEFKCYRSENFCTWPKMQKNLETSKQALFVSVHGNPVDEPETNRLVRVTPQCQLLQQPPCDIKNTIQSTVKCKSSAKPRCLSNEHFTIGSIGGDGESKSILKKPSASDNRQPPKQKKKVKHIYPEVIDIKVSKDIKSTKLKNRFFKDGERPGYVAVLSTPCNCPDITIFLPCCCGLNSWSDVVQHTFDREAQRYAIVPTQKEGID